MLLKLCRFVTVLSCCLLIACAPAQLPPKPEPAPVQVVAPVIDYEARERRLVAMLLSRAQSALHNDQLMTPANDNAYGWYQQVLAHDGDNTEAHWGMRQIGARYLELAEQSYIAGERYRAQLFLEKGESVSLSPQRAKKMRQKYKHVVKDVPANEFLLDGRGLSNRSEAMIVQLSEIAALAREQSSRLTIYARSDTEGRWVYKQMRDAVDGFRLRGNIQLSRTPRIVLIDLKD